MESKQRLMIGTLLISCAIARSIYQDSCVIDPTRGEMRFVEHFYRRDDARGMKLPRDECRYDGVVLWTPFCAAIRRDLFAEAVARERTRDPRKRVSGYNSAYGNASNDKYSML